MTFRTFENQIISVVSLDMVERYITKHDYFINRLLSGQIMTNMIDLGLGGWMADFGEYLPVDAVVNDTSISIEAMHNKWPLLWAKLNRQAVEDSGKLGEVVFWMRSGAAGKFI